MSVQIKMISPPRVDRKCILHYANAEETEGISNLLDSLLEEISDKLVYRVCYRVTEVAVTDDICDFGVFSVKAGDLARNLRGCQQVVIFAASIGIELDRMIARYSRLSPAKALLLQAIGTERVEALCDAFCENVSLELGLQCRPRFSPGYGNVPLAIQRNLFDVLECQKHIGVYLTESLLMVPTKSVTAFVGLQGEEGNI